MLGGIAAGLSGALADVAAHLNPIFYLFVPYWTLILSALVLSPVTVLLPQFIQGKLTWPSSKDAPDIWIVHGKKYNLKPWYKSHPGGEFALRAAKGSDCTGLFESYHVFTDREVLLKTLARYEIKEEGETKVDEPAMVFYDAFYEDLKGIVREYFKGKGKNAHKMTSPHIALCFVAWVTMWAMIYSILFHDAMWCIPFVGVLSWYLTGNVMHDASHNAFVADPTLNRVLSHAAFPYGVNVTSWHIQHVMSHHIYTNEEDDVDLFHFEPVIILKPGENSVNLVLHVLRLLFILSTAIPHLTFVVPYGVLFGQVDPMNGHSMYDRVKAIKAHRAELKWEMIVEVLALLAFYFACWWQHGAIKAVCVQMSIYTISSYLFCFFTQVSHLQKECLQDPQALKGQSFARRQVASSMDFAPDSAFWGHISGGLNTQAIHHCFPSVSAMHLRALYPAFRKVCKKHGVLLKEAPSLRSFVWGFVQFAN
mmetsp:Transcript_45806/g.133371  ORF Transcript_45806/g.133371 Transcript_45806/m.133371 type:complete len:479 (+) Transcript_45806:87-1523(+)